MVFYVCNETMARLLHDSVHYTCTEVARVVSSESADVVELVTVLRYTVVHTPGNDATLCKAILEHSKQQCWRTGHAIINDMFTSAYVCIHRDNLSSEACSQCCLQ
jgi:hypothetical protein